MNRRRWRPLVAAASLVILAMTSCSQEQQAPPPQVPEVAVFTVQPESVLLTSDLPGRTAAFRVAEIRPQVSGLIEKRLFTEGADVKQGEVLYQIDPRPFQAALDNATASLDAAREAAERARSTLAASLANVKRYEAILTLATTNRKRFENLVKSNAVSAMQLDQAISEMSTADAGLRVAQAQVESDRKAVDAAEAAIKQAEAAVESAKINLAYTKITAPISGRIGRSEITEGAMATAYQAVPLATIQQLDPIYVDVPQSTVELNRLKRSLANGRLKENDTDRVKIFLEDDTEYPLEGSLKFRDVTVDPTTGSVILRIVVPNPDGVLLPGMFVRAIVEEGVNEQAILIPQQAVSRDPRGNPIALVVDNEGKVEQRGLTTDQRAFGDKWLVSSGLSRGERVIVEGLQRVRPGATVKVVPLEAEGTNAAKAVSTAQAATQLN